MLYHVEEFTAAEGHGSWFMVVMSDVYDRISDCYCRFLPAKLTSRQLPISSRQIID